MGSEFWSTKGSDGLLTKTVLMNAFSKAREVYVPSVPILPARMAGDSILTTITERYEYVVFYVGDAICVSDEDLLPSGSDEPPTT